jgi:hypothetical protein
VGRWHDFRSTEDPFFTGPFATCIIGIFRILDALSGELSDLILISCMAAAGMQGGETPPGDARTLHLRFAGRRLSKPSKTTRD